MGQANKRGTLQQRIAQAEQAYEQSQAAVTSIRISIVGPEKHPEHGEIHRVEVGIKTGKDVDAIAFAVKSSVTAEAVDVVSKLVKDFMADPQAGFRKKISLPIVGPNGEDAS